MLFTSYAAMSAIKERLTEMDLPWEVFTLSRNAVHTTQEFKDSPGSILLATGAAWEGFDFPGDCVSLLVIPRLPFSRPDALKEKKRAEYPTLRAFIRAAVVPEMQIKLKQGFGRAIRTETDTCVVAILDERASPGQRHHEAMLATLPDMEITDSLEDVVEFIYRTKDAGYFHHEKQVMFREYPDVVDVDDLCKMLGGISRKLAYRLLADQKIRSVRIGRSYKIPKAYVIEYLTQDP